MMFRPSPDRLLPELDPPLQVVLLARSLWREGYDDHLAGLITYNLGDGTLLCNPWLLTWDEFSTEDVVRINLDGSVIEGEWPAPPGLPLHLEMHKARPDVGVALHHRPRWGTIWADLGRVPGRHDQSSVLGGGRAVVVDTYTAASDLRGRAGDAAGSEATAASRAVAAIGDADIAVLVHQGVLVLGNTVRTVHQRAVAFEQRSRSAWLVDMAGGGVELPTLLLERSEVGDGEKLIGVWEAMARRELRADPSLLTRKLTRNRL